GEDGGEGQQDEAAMSRSGQGRFQGLEDGVDRPGERAAEPLELAAAQAGLAGGVAALFPREPSLPAAAGAGRLGLLTVVGRGGGSALLRGQALAGAGGETGHGSLPGCAVRARSPSLPCTRGAPPPRTPQNCQSP